MIKPLYRLASLVTMLVLAISSTASVSLASPPEPETLPPRRGLVRMPLPSLRSPAADMPPAAALPGVADLVLWSDLTWASLGDQQDFEIMWAHGDTTGPMQLTSNTADDYAPKINRGCTRIAFDSGRDGNYEIYTMNMNGSNPTRLTTHSASDITPAWSPDGSKIAFASNREGQYEIYVMNANGSSLTRLTFHSDLDSSPTWSPDGSKIAFSSYRSSQYSIWMMNADGTSQVQLSDQPSSFDPAWSPDGSRILFDADSNQDGWWELWTMNADGSNEQMLLSVSPPLDLTAGTWSADGRYVSFTEVSWVEIEGDWYWESAYIKYRDTQPPYSTGYLNSFGTEWYPAWTSCDIEAPNSWVNALPAFSQASFVVSWTGIEPGSSGIKFYDVQVRAGAGGAWTDWQVNTTTSSAVFNGVNGVSYYFRSRARDNAFNQEAYPPTHDAMTTVDFQSPFSRVQPLPELSRSIAWVQWGGADAGPAGIAAYDVQVRDGLGGSWVNWQLGTPYTAAGFDGLDGHTYYFRSRARDNASNWESWPTLWDASTTLYSWKIDGMISDNRNNPINGATVNTVPAAFLYYPSDPFGEYAAYVATGNSASVVSWNKSGYGEIPPTAFSTSLDETWDVTLPPENNIVRNWGFESGDLGTNAWFAGGAIADPVVSGGHSGGFSGYIGTNTPGESYLSQVLNVPITLTHPTLSFYYVIEDPPVSSLNEFSVELEDDLAETELFSTMYSDLWEHRWFDLTPWAGEVITLTFNVHEEEGNDPTFVRLDEVSIGSSFADLWLHKTSSDGAALPGETLTYTINFGNRSLIPVSSVIITDTLPADLGSSPPPHHQT
jgi:uncharacterized repeat protein (TIGR01451 family)